MFGVTIDVVAIIVGSLLGVLLGKNVDEKLKKRMVDAMGISVICIGICDLIKVENTLILMLSLVFGGVYGTMVGINSGIKKLGKFISEGLAKKSNKRLTLEQVKERNYAMVDAAILYSVGAMVIYGSIKSGLGDYSTMYVKAVLDFLTAIIFCVKGGLYVILAAIPTLIIETIFCLLSGVLSPYLTPVFINQLSATGGAIMIIMGLSQLEIKKMPAADFIFALFGAIAVLFI